MTKKYLFLLFYFLLHIFLFGQEIKFQLFESDAILGTGTVYCVMQDRTGFIWLGTEYGLYRYDGHDLKIFRNDPDNANSLSDNTVWSLYEDNRGFIWVGTANGGINRLDPVTEKFISWQSTKSFSATGPGLSDNGITAIIQDKNGYIWIGTYKGGLNRFDTKTNRFFHWYKDSLSANTLPVNYVTSLLVDQENQLWIGSYEGLYSMEAEGSSTDFKYWNVFQQKNSELSSQIVWNLFESPYDTGTGFWVGTFSGLKFFNKKKGIIRNYQAEPIKNNLFSNSYGSISEEVINGERVMWIGTYGGLLQFNLSTGKFVRYQYQEDKIGSISNDRVIDIMIDRSGVLWIATSGGLNYITSRYNNFKNWTYRKSGKNISLKDVTSVCSFKDGSIWIGATSGLYTISNPELSTQVTKYTGFNETEIWTLTPGNNQNLWIGTYGNGLFLLNLKTGKITHWTSNSEIPGSLGNDYIKSLCFDSSGYLWIGLWGKGLNRFHPTSGEWRYYLSDRDNPNSLSYNDVWSLYEDKFGNLWVGTKGGGLNLYDRNTRKFKRWLNNSSKIQWLSHNGILTITEAQPFSNNISDSLAALWIGTENGITYFLYNPYSPDSATTKINTFSVKNGLPGNIIRGISEVNNKLWLGLNTGLVSMDNELVMNSEDNPEKIRRLQQLKLNHYTVKNGLPENDFASGAVILSKSGKLFWGNSGGLISFNPNEIKENLLIAPTVITEILINNRKIQRGTFNFPDSSFQLRYNENTVSFRFSALDYKAPKDCRYAYRLVGLDKEWIDVGKQRIANYSNLSPGNYTFEVKSTNSDEIWNQNPAKISFSISPPWWLSLWAYSLYVLIVFGIFFFLRKYELNRIRLKHQLELQMFETRKLKELEKIKSRFFTNLSHEFRTPLMLISGPVEQLRDKIFTGNENEMYDLIIRNTSRLSELIEQLLALSQLEAGSLPLHASKKNLVPILKGLVFSFESFAHNKGINLFFSASEDTIIAWIDQDKFEKIINNLLSNALKFTPKGGKVEVKIEFPSALVPGNNTIIIKILDTGIGISSDLHEKVFDRFFQVDDSAKRLYSGSGIGLALVKELTDLHHWRISLESKPNEGSQFTIFIPEGNEHLLEDEIVKIQSDENTKLEKNTIQRIGFEKIDENRYDKSTAEKPLILIIEDSEDVRLYLYNLLYNDYKIIQANNGKTGLQKAESELPDLIVTDIMMPGMDGMEFCRILKTNLQTCHIPVILLTAKGNIESKIAGLETGADEYITKPFNYSELLVRIKNLLTQRRILREKYAKELYVHPSAVTANSLDKEFLKKAIEISENNLDNSNFESEQFAKELFVSRSQLHRKLRAITGLAPGEFIRNIRIKRAARLLLEKKLSVTQIAYEVGFASPSHFTKAFKKQFKCLPSEFIEKANT